VPVILVQGVVVVAVVQVIVEGMEEEDVAAVVISRLRLHSFSVK
jgi:hypothetical protein